MTEQLDLQIAPELLSARDVAILLKITPRAVRLRMAKITPVMRSGIQAWPLDLLPIDYRDQLTFVRKRAHALTLAEVVEQARPRWEPGFKFASLPPFSQGKAYKVRAVMLVYFAALDSDATQHEANCAARQKWLEEFSASCAEKTIRNWADKIDERGGIEWAPLEAYADRKACPHQAARLENREKRKVPGELIAVFKERTTGAGMNIAAGFRSLEEEWQAGKAVPGVGAMTEPRQPFPFKITQLRKFAPSSAARLLGNRGKAAARRDALPHMTRTYAQLRPCELYILDDTRINVTALDDTTLKPVELKCYICIEAASRAVVGYVIREGSMRASDVDALIAQVLRTAGVAHAKAGYATHLQFERGTIACSPQRQHFLEALMPGRLVVLRTSMDGGQNFAGDYVQARSGHWMGKAVIESFMRTLGYWLLHLPGQRGSTWAKMPSMVGYPGDGAHADSMVDENEKLVRAAVEKAYLDSHGLDEMPNPAQAVDAAGIKLPLKRVSEFRQSFARMIEHYNSHTRHRREGFRQLPVETGGWRMESSNERWSHLVWQEQQRGTAPERLSPAEAALLLHKARKVTVTQQGVEMTVENVKHRYWHQDSIAIEQAGLITGGAKEFTAIHHPDDLSEIYILRNPPRAYQVGDTPRFLECLPLYLKPGVRDRAAMSAAFETQRQVHNRRIGELADANEERMQRLTADRAENTSKFVGVVATRGEYHEVSGVSSLLKSMGAQHNKLADHPAAQPESPSRHVPAPDEVSEWVKARAAQKEEA